MSSMLRIPTVVWIGDYKDGHRDSRFIDPYVKAGIMETFRYRNLNDMHEISAGIAFSLSRIWERLQDAA